MVDFPASHAYITRIMDSLISTSMLLFLVMDPLGNLPFFISTLRDVPRERYRLVVLRESLIALAVLALFLLLGRRILDVLGISQASLGIAGGIILFLIALKMIFSAPEENKGLRRGEPLIVPLAIPMIAGPSAVATIILVRGKGEALLGWSALALLAAWLAATVILLFSRSIAKAVGDKALDASESLMGLLLTALAVEMFVNGAKNAFLPH